MENKKIARTLSDMSWSGEVEMYVNPDSTLYLDSEGNELLYIDYSNNKEVFTFYVKDVFKHLQSLQLKKKARHLVELNKRVNDRKATLLLNLALNEACSYGELINSIAMCTKILD